MRMKPDWNGYSARVKEGLVVLNRVRVLGAGPHLPIQGYIKYPPPPPGSTVGHLSFCFGREFIAFKFQVAIWAVTSDQKTRQVVTYKRLKTIENC